MISYLFGIYCIDETVVRRSAGFWTIIAQFSTCHNLTVATAYWLFSLVDPYSALSAYFSDAVLHSRDVIFMSLLSDISAVYSAIFNYFCQCMLLSFSTIFSFNVQ